MGTVSVENNDEIDDGSCNAETVRGAKDEVKPVELNVASLTRGTTNVLGEAADVVEDEARVGNNDANTASALLEFVEASC